MSASFPCPFPIRDANVFKSMSLVRSNRKSVDSYVISVLLRRDLCKSETNVGSGIGHIGQMWNAS